ncbi:MAG: hypothetical protein OIF47_06405 [Marinibacterium sp.]|nr:hypothetical protein [Marinibacterium sp.]
MSDTDSFIDEVTEEVRRDRLYALLRRYGWIAVLLIFAIVGGAAFSEYRKAQIRAEAEALGDAILTALEADDDATRAERLDAIDTEGAGQAAIVAMLDATAKANAGDTDGAVAVLNTITPTGDLPPIYPAMAQFKALVLQGDSTPVETRRIAFEALAQPGAPLRLLAEEQLALIALEEGDSQGAIDRFQALLQDAEVSRAQSQRVAQMIVALGAIPVVVTPGQQG